LLSGIVLALRLSGLLSFQGLHVEEVVKISPKAAVKFKGITIFRTRLRLSGGFGRGGLFAGRACLRRDIQSEADDERQRYEFEMGERTECFHSVLQEIKLLPAETRREKALVPK
jgi:hypothetical protein